jgi:hypothetical protein
METRREPDVVRVAVSQDDSADVVDGPAHAGELVLEFAPLSGQARIDDRHLAGLFDQIAVDDAGSDLMEGRGELHRSPLEESLAFALVPGYDGR